MPVILATQEAQIRIVVWSQSGQIVLKTLSQKKKKKKKPSQKRDGAVVQGVHSTAKQTNNLQMITNVGKDVGEKEPSYTAGGNVN
jgi:hypothetical protein